jgi:hypothetical protein
MIGIEPKKKGIILVHLVLVIVTVLGYHNSNNLDQLFYNPMLFVCVPAKTGKTQILMYRKKKIPTKTISSKGKRKKKHNKIPFKIPVQCTTLTKMKKTEDSNALHG